MENDQCILIKKKDYEVLIGNQEQIIKKHTDVNYKLTKEIFDLKQRIKELENLPRKVKVNPLKLEVILKEVHTGLHTGVEEISTYYTRPINFSLDRNLSRQILNIVGIISKKLINIKIEKEYVMREKLIQEITESNSEECYKKMANMNWLNRIDFLRKYKK